MGEGSLVPRPHPKISRMGPGNEARGREGIEG